MDKQQQFNLWFFVAAFVLLLLFQSWMSTASVTERIPYSLGIFLPGYSDNLAHRLGLINSDLPLEAAREQYMVDEKSAANLDASDFSHRIRNQSDVISHR